MQPKIQPYALLPCALGLALSLTVPATAQSDRVRLGIIEAEIDGAPYRGETLHLPSEGTASAEARLFGPMTSLTLQAHDPQAESIMRNVLSVEISLMGHDASASIVEASVSYWPDGMSEPFYLSEDSGVQTDVVLDSFTFDDGESRVKGSFSGQVCRRGSFFSEPDTSDCLSIKGIFDTALRNAD